MSQEKSVSGGRVSMVTIDDASQGQRLDNFLIRHLKGVPRTLVYRVIRKGEVRVNKARCRPETRLEIGDIVRIPPVRTGEEEGNVPVNGMLMQRLQSSILYEDDGLIALNKPQGIAVHGGSGVSHGVIEALRVLRPEARFLELVHRLDRDTSGLLLIAKRRPVLLELHDLLQRGGIDKRYHAWVAGRWPAQLREVTAPLAKNALASGERIVIVKQDGKASHTRFTVLRRERDCTLVEAVPVTGRTHQIRVHARFAGHPILGDTKYGFEEVNRVYRDCGVKRLCLHAWCLRIAWRHRPVQELVAPWEFQDRLPEACFSEPSGGDR